MVPLSIYIVFPSPLPLKRSRQVPEGRLEHGAGGWRFLRWRGGGACTLVVWDHWTCHHILLMQKAKNNYYVLVRKLSVQNRSPKAPHSNTGTSTVQCFGSGRSNWVSGSGLGIRIRIQSGLNWPPKRKKMKKFMFEESERPLYGFLKKSHMWQLLIKTISNYKFTNFVILNLGRNPDPDWICFQHQAGSKSRFCKIPGSGFSECGSETLVQSLPAIEYWWHVFF